MAPVQARREQTCRQFLQLLAFSSSLLARALPIISSANCTQWDKVRQLVSRTGSAIESGRYLWQGNGNPLQYFCLGNPMDRGAWKGYSPWWSERVRHDWVTKHTHTNTCTHTHSYSTHTWLNWIWTILVSDFWLHLIPTTGWLYYMMPLPNNWRSRISTCHLIQRQWPCCMVYTSIAWTIKVT